MKTVKSPPYQGLAFGVTFGATITLSGGLASTAMAQNDSVELAPVEVWSTEVSTSSVGAESINIKQPDHVSDILRTMPGVDVGGAHSLNQRITIRSMDDKDLRISIDGANQNTYMYHHMGNLQIHADILESVDVEVGNNSVINGGLGGTVRFVTKSAKKLLDPGQQFGGRAQLTAGDNSGTSAALTGYGKLGESADFLAYINAVDRDNYEVGGGEILDYNGNVVPGTDGTVRGLEGELTDALIKLGLDIGDSQRLEFGYEAYVDEGDYSYRPDMGLATDLAIAGNLGTPLTWPTEFTRDTMTVNYSGDVSDNSWVQATLFNNVSELERDENGWGLNPAFADYAGIVTGEANNSGLNALAETELGMHTLTYGGEYINYDTSYLYTFTGGGSESSEEEATNMALYIQDRIQFTDRFSLTPGIRYSNYDLESVVVDDSFSETTGALAAEFIATPDLTLGLSATQLFKGPEIGEVFTGAGLYDTPNPDIEAETGYNTELSLAYLRDLGNSSQFLTGLTVFQTRIDNYIYDYALSPAGEYFKDNVGDMTIDGYEAYIGFNKGNLRTLLTASLADSELDALSTYPEFEGARLDRVQGDTFSILVDYDIPHRGLSFHWDALFVGSVEADLDLDGATEDNAKDGYTVHNVSVRWSPQQRKGLAITLGVDNLFDEFYSSQSSRTGLSRHPRFGELYLFDYEPGRNIKATVSYTF